jgi:hypothetical protein
VWGGKNAAKQSDEVTPASAAPKTKSEKHRKKDEDLDDEPKKRKRSDREANAISESRNRVPSPDDKPAADVTELSGVSKKRKRSKPNKGADTKAEPAAPTPAVKPSTEKSKPIALPSVPPQIAPLANEIKRKPVKRSEGGKVETVKSSAGGVNLNEVYSKPKAQDDAGGLGVGGW